MRGKLERDSATCLEREGFVLGLPQLMGKVVSLLRMK